MTLEQLRIFVAVAQRQHVTRAAEALNITQSAASNAIAALEKQHGTQLFHRIGRRIELTEAGTMFLGEARAVLDRASAAELALAEYGELKRGTLRVVASQTVASYWLPGRLAAFRARHPGISIELSIDNSEGAARRVLDGTAELGVVEGAIDEPALASWTVGEDRMLLVTSSPVGKVDDDWLRSARWIVREQGSGTRSTFEEILRARGFDPRELRIAMVMPSNEAVRSAVEAGAGVAVLSEFVVRRALATGELHRLEFPMPARPFHALRHKERYRTRAADAMADLLRETRK
ncbi:LysR family transcriptional regulator [Komagataeibacter melaceti]|uniref:LysR family transcriptional regulator n=1 Tax=Komagataeibacter melaceti TaxID=2766577 RepID=A0A371Z4G0_9PROT|nr:LysR family transcriptional regulator [Komagataeibacter melaceti]RFD21374.1 LysR family transcriptional regulator [Komagataeibacter melaceti]